MAAPVATIAIVVFLSSASVLAAGSPVTAGVPKPYDRSSGSNHRPPAGEPMVPSEFAATRAATTVPPGRRIAKDPSPLRRLWNPERAPSPAPTLPLTDSSAVAPEAADSAARAARAPSSGVGGETDPSPRPRSKIAAAGTRIGRAHV